MSKAWTGPVTEDDDGSVALCDDGTLDTVVEYTCKHCDVVSEHRFSDVERDESGTIVVTEWERLLGDCAEDHVQGDCGNPED